MKTQASRSRRLPLLIISIALSVLSAAGAAAMIVWRAGLIDGSGGNTAHVDLASSGKVDQIQGKARARFNCAECGVVVSIRENTLDDEDSGAAAGERRAENSDGASKGAPRNLEIIIRMADGSSRVIDPASTARWRVGERLIVIDGATPSNQ